MTKSFLLPVIFILSGPLWAQKEPMSQEEAFLREGKIITLRLIPRAKDLQMEIVGTKVAELKASEVGLEAYIRTGNRLERKLTLKRDPDGGYFIENFTRPADLRVQVKAPQNKEFFDFHLD